MPFGYSCSSCISTEFYFHRINETDEGVILTIFHEVRRLHLISTPISTLAKNTNFIRLGARKLTLRRFAGLIFGQVVGGCCVFPLLTIARTHGGQATLGA